MNYKYKRGQIFGKRLKVPKGILLKVYNCTLSFQEFIKYELEDKIPITCLNREDRPIVQKFGIEKAKTFDWELLDTIVFYTTVDFKEFLMQCSQDDEDINEKLNELASDNLKPVDYTKRLQERYPDRMALSLDDYSLDQRYVVNRFNSGELSLVEIISNWELFKDKDLSICLKNDSDNRMGITSSELKTFMSTFQNFIYLMLEKDSIYSLIQDFNSLGEQERLDYVKKITDSILEKTIRKEGYHSVLELSIEEYKELFQYSSIQDYLKKTFPEVENYIDKLFEELKDLPQNYLLDASIPFEVLKNSNVLRFIGIFGIKNTIDFDKECGNFFTKDNYNMLQSMYEMYMHYGINQQDPKKSIFTRKLYDENGNYMNRPYTKDEFYEAIKRMIMYGPSDVNYAPKAPDYRSITGEFRVRNASLFISEQAPEELQKEFYTKNITPQFLAEHPDYIPYLEGKNLSSCFKEIYIFVGKESESLYSYENFYDFMGEKLNFNELMNFIIEYRDVFSVVFDKSMSNRYLYEIRFFKEDNIEEIKRKINNSFRKIIVEQGVVYPKNIPQNLRAEYPSMFLSLDAPQELQEAFYNRTITSGFILSNPIYKEYLKKVDLELRCKYMPVTITEKGKINLINVIAQIFGSEDSFEVMLQYGKYLETVFEKNHLCEFQFHSEFSKNDLLMELDSVILKAIMNGEMKYDENMPIHFKNVNPTLFLDSQVPQDIRDKFYNREFMVEDFDSNPSLLDLFSHTNIVCGFPTELSWMISLFSDSNDFKETNQNRLKLVQGHYRIQDTVLQNVFKESIMGFENNINMEKVDSIVEVLERLSFSNSSEMYKFRKEIAVQLLKTENPLERLDKIEEKFIKNNIPIVGKIYSCFEILHPDFQGFSFEEPSMISPVLCSSSTMRKKAIVFADLIKASFGSNNKSVLAYLNNIEIGSLLYESIKNGEKTYDMLSVEEKQELLIFSNHLATLYNNTLRGKKEENEFRVSGDTISDIQKLSGLLSTNGNLDYNLADRVIRMFCGLAGINTLEQAKYYIHMKVDTADSRNRESSKYDMTLEQGDFIKGIGGIKYLRNILQNGSVSKEFLGSSADSDSTPLDTDASMILTDGTICKKMANTAASSYGPIWFVLKNDGRFNITRTSSEKIEQPKDIGKLEAFYTGVVGSDHYGIRTGFASSEINYIVMDNYDSRVGLEIAMNGFYIPVANSEGKIVFTPDDYDKIREKMSGLSYFGENSYHFSDNLVTEETEYFASQIENSNQEVDVKRAQINEMIRMSLEELGLKLKTVIDGDLTEGFVEIIDTGSTGRGTNKPGDGDFDFMMRLDKTILLNPSKLNELKQNLLKKLGKEDSNEITGSGDFRLKQVSLPSSATVDIDITFTEKTDKISYSTDMSLQDRLATIQKSDNEKYKYVVANILLAKRVLKEAGAYKPNRGEVPQGGLGGVGIENWILQNGGSFIDAATSFLESAEGKTFEEFKDSYPVWDFGDNHLAEKKGYYPHDNFVSNNMSGEGYQKMVQALKEYLKTVQLSQTESFHK